MEWLSHPASPLIWENVIYAGLIFVSMLYFLIAILGGVFHSDAVDAPNGDGHGVGHADAGAHADHHLAHGVEVHEAHHLDHAGGGHAAHIDGVHALQGHGDSHHSHDTHQAPSSEGVTGFLVGLFNTEHRCPLTLAITTFMLMWGILGYIANMFLLPQFPDFHVPVFLLGFAGTSLGSLLIVRRIAPIVAKTMPSGKLSTGKYDVIGLTATPSTILEPGRVGFIDVQIEGGDLMKLARLESYEGPALRRGDKVLVCDYDEGSDTYIVTPLRRDQQ